ESPPTGPRRAASLVRATDGAGGVVAGRRCAGRVRGPLDTDPPGVRLGTLCGVRCALTQARGERGARQRNLSGHRVEENTALQIVRVRTGGVVAAAHIGHADSALASARAAPDDR